MWQSATYTYTDDYLTKIQTPSTTYSFTYGDFGLRESVKIGNRTLATYKYTEETKKGDEDDHNYDLDRLDYGNGDRVEYEYDGKGRVIKETFMDGDTEQGTVTYAYDNNGALAKVTDSATGITTTYYYDFTDRMMKYVESSDGYSHSVGYEYDVQNNLTQLVETINGVEHTTSYTYDDDNRIESVTNGAVREDYSYDEFGRVDSQTTQHNGTDVVTKYVTFQSPASGKTSAQIDTYQIDSEGYTVVYTYTYDDNGNITSVFDGIYTTSYAYDSANQLIRENNQAGGFTRTWTYDDGGNIISIDEYDYTTGELGEPNDTYSYYYDDSAWGDLQTERYDAELVTDAIGNLLEDDMWTYTWEHGRQLASMSSSPSNVWTFTYNADGMRTKRANGTNTYTYVYNGSQLTQMTKGTDTLYFTYDAGGTPIAVTYNGTVYYYATNLQGDIVAILNSASTAVVKYAYDAWGNPLSRTGTMASTLGALNPLRYRGYVYDQETSLYYLQSRYYNPAIGRFINADKFVSTGQGLLGYNMFAYCGNNPINRIDPTGQAFWTVLGIIVITAMVLSIPSSQDQTPFMEKAAREKYNEDTINFCVDEIGTDADKLNVTFYPDSGLIHIEDSWSISSKEEKLAVIDEIVNCDYYDPTVYGNSTETMLMEWSGHNFVYRTASSSKLAYKFYQWRGYDDPIKSTRGVDFRKSLLPSSRKNYELVTLWGIIQW